MWHFRTINSTQSSVINKRNFWTHLCDLFCDIVRSVFDLWGYNGLLRCLRRMSLFISHLGEVECNQWNLTDSAIFVDVRIGGRAKQTGLHMVERAWRVRGKKNSLISLVNLSQFANCEKRLKDAALFLSE